MSTILKALKRLEQEKEALRPTGPTPVFSRSSSTLGGLAGWFLTPWFRRGALGLMIIVMSGVAFHFFSQSRQPAARQAGRTGQAQKNNFPSAKAELHSPGPSATAPVEIRGSGPTGSKNSRNAQKPAADRSAMVSQTKSRAADVNANRSRPALPSVSKGADAPIREHPNRAPTPSSADARAPEAVSGRARPTGMPGAEISAPSEGAGQTRAVPEAPLPTVSSPPDTKRSSDAYENTPQLNDGRLKVHAIAWSPVVEERMAVVNNRVIYEGDSVDNFTVVAIRPDDVVVREKEKGLWRIVFGRP